MSRLRDVSGKRPTGESMDQLGEEGKAVAWCQGSTSRGGTRAHAQEGAHASSP